MTAVSIRKAAARDLRAMYQLDQRCFSDAFRFSFRAMSNFFYQTDTISVVAETAERLAGFAIVQLGSSEAYLLTLDVDPTLRRSGIAGLLMQEAEEAARLEDVDCVVLHVWSENVGAIAFYESRGYTAMAEVPDYYGAGRNARVYRKAMS